MKTDTVIIKGKLQFQPNKQEQVESVLTHLLTIMTGYMNGAFDKDAYNEHYNPRGERATEDGRIVSIKETEFFDNTLASSDKVDFYFHSDGVFLSDVFDNLIENINMFGNYSEGLLDGLAINIEKYLTTEYLGGLRTSKLSYSILIEQDATGEYGYSIRNYTSQLLDSTISTLTEHTHLFAFDTRYNNGMVHFTELLNDIVHEYPDGVLENKHDYIIAKAILNAITILGVKEDFGINMKELRFIVQNETGVEFSVGMKEAIGVIRTIIPKIREEIMINGRVN